MNKSQLERLLNRTPYSKFLDVIPTGSQLPSFIATICGLKPAMDLWVESGAWQAFEELIRYFGLCYRVDGHFDRYAEQLLVAIPEDRITTTRAAWTKGFKDRVEAHVFIARTPSNLTQAIQAGWYPLEINGHFVEKHLADHDKFGRALGYPDCCLDFFRCRNNWHIDNTYYAAFRNTNDVAYGLSNGLLRHTAFTFAPHMPCSFACKDTVNYAAGLQTVIEEEVPNYAQEIMRRLTTPILCLSELRIYQFEGSATTPTSITYTNVEPVSPTTPTDSLYLFLKEGNRCLLERNIIRILKGSTQISAYFARADRHGPEFPFIIQCRP